MVGNAGISFLHQLYRVFLEAAVRTAPVGTLDSLQRILHHRRGFGFVPGVETEAAVFTNLLGQDGGVIFDVGANVGEWSVSLRSQMPACAIHAFEPSSAAFITLNGRFHNDVNVSCHQTAVGDSCGSARLFADSPGSSLGSLTARDLDRFGLTFSFSEKVALTTLDWFCEEQGLRPVGLKIDVEGNELEVLRGAENVLAEVRVVQFELGGTNLDSRTYFKDFFDFLTTRGFSLWRLAPGGLLAVHHYSELDEVFRFTNYFATRVQA